MINRPKNTKEKGMLEYLFYKEADHYVGVCLTFDIVEEGENLEELKQSVMEAAKLHLRTVLAKDLPDELLNRYAPQEYWDIYLDSLEKVQEQKLPKIPLTFQVSQYFNGMSLQYA
jgi:predicted RNase H-like HicB family nuclease